MDAWREQVKEICKQVHRGMPKHMPLVIQFGPGRTFKLLITQVTASHVRSCNFNRRTFCRLGNSFRKML